MALERLEILQQPPRASDALEGTCQQPSPARRCFTAVSFIPVPGIAAGCVRQLLTLAEGKSLNSCEVLVPNGLGALHQTAGTARLTLCQHMLGGDRRLGFLRL